MRHLQRPQPEPACLSKYDYIIHNWSGRKPNKSDRVAIWNDLERMQGKFCCYCESVAVRGNGHIEHFFYKGKQADGHAPYKHLTFVWSNLFGSCGLHTGDTCGHFKDRDGPSGPGYYDPSHLIKPDIESSIDFFEFLPTGVINPKPGLSSALANRASETLRILNLSALNGVRKRQIDIFKKELEALLQLTADDEVIRQEIDKIKAKIKVSEYQTAVLCALFG